MGNEVAVGAMGNAGDLMEMMRMTTMNISQMSQQMGLVTRQISEINSRMSGIESRMQKYEDEIRLTRDQARRLKGAIHGRVNYLLGIKTEGGVTAKECLSDEKRYRGGFIARAYTDARNHSRLGTPYTETTQRDYQEVLSYIERWEPEVTFNGASGTVAYKQYLDIRNSEKVVD